MAELADAADLKSADPKGLWGFESPSRHHLTSLSACSTRGIVLPWTSGERLCGEPQLPGYHRAVRQTSQTDQSRKRETTMGISGEVWPFSPLMQYIENYFDRAAPVALTRIARRT
jgi:hypothetical protein